MNGRHFESIFREDLFADRVIFVTGGGSGIGRCTAHELAALGAKVVIGGRRPEPLERTAREIEAAGGRAATVQIDIRDEEQVDGAVAGIVRDEGRLDGLVNNAGGQFAAPLEEISVSAWRKVVDLNLTGTYLVSMAAYRHWMKQNGGAIVNMLMDLSTGYPGMAHSAAARAGIQNLAMTLSMEWAASDVRVNCVAPGTILSSGMMTYPKAVQEEAAAGAKNSPACRLGTESEVSSVIAFLLSPAAAYVSGETVCIDGGARFQKGRLIAVGDHAPTRAWNGFHLRPDFRGTPFEEEAGSA